jgi:hypothetical protein
MTDMAPDDRDPLDAFLADDPLPLPPLAPDGGFVPGHVDAEPLPQVTPETMVCLRDCRHYVEIVSRFNHGNARGTLAHEPRQVNRFCAAIAGTDIDLTDELVRECNMWDPTPELFSARQFRQEQWARDHLVQITPRPST